MYSLIFMAALATTNQAPDFWLLHHCADRGRNGCGYGYGPNGCGSCGQGAYGCGRCWGNGCWGHCGWGGYYGGIDYYGYESLCGDNGWFDGRSCDYGGGYWGCHHGDFAPGGLGGYYGDYDGGPDDGYLPGSPAPVGPGQAAPMPPAGGSPKGSPTLSGARANGKARLIVDVPEEARVYVDGTLTKSTSTRRVFTTPHLDAGQSYYYEFRIEVERDGKTYRENKRVIVKAGDNHQESFADLGKRPGDTAVADAQK